MDGDNLKIALARHSWTGLKLAKTMKKGKRTIYDWFAKDKLKRTLLEEISQVTKIPIEELVKSREVKPVTGVVHHGEIILSVIEEKMMSKEAFAKKMHLSRQTVYRRFGEKEWPIDQMLLAAEVLNVPVAQLRGKGQGQRAFEKDIYEHLMKIEAQTQHLAEIKGMLQLLVDKRITKGK